LLPLLNSKPNFKIAVVPRHPERFVEVYEQVKSLCSDVVRYSEVLGKSGWKVMVVDALGLLCTFYQLSKISIVAGSYVERVGGHNILEPAAVGVPVIVGPYMHSQHSLFTSAQEHEAVISTTIESLPQITQNLLKDSSKESARVKEWANRLRGATDRSLEALSRFVKHRPK